MAHMFEWHKIQQIGETVDLNEVDMKKKYQQIKTSSALNRLLITKANKTLSFSKVSLFLLSLKSTRTR